MAWGIELNSATHLVFNDLISQDEWIKFCDDTGLEGCPGRGVFYGGNTGKVTVHIGDNQMFNGHMPIETAYASVLTPFYRGDRKGVADITAAICERWPAVIFWCDTELMPFMSDRCLAVLPREKPKEKCSG